MSVTENEAKRPKVAIVGGGRNAGRTLKAQLDLLEELEAYRAIGTVEELQKSVKEEDVLKFYYIESEDKYVVGRRVDNFYYGEVGKTGLAFYMSRYLPWGEHVVAPDTLWKEHTYPSEPKEIPFFDWLQGFMKKEYGCTVEEVKNTYGRGYNQGGIDRAEELQKCREYGYNKAVDECYMKAKTMMEELAYQNQGRRNGKTHRVYCIQALEFLRQVAEQMKGEKA